MSLAMTIMKKQTYQTQQWVKPWRWWRNKLIKHKNEFSHDDDEETNLLKTTMSLAMTMMKKQTY